LKKRPRDYSEFKGSTVGTATTKYSSEQFNDNEGKAKTIKASSASYIDDINPNKKYYYMFRSVDVHGNVSNPSPVYEVELVNDAGFVYPLIKIIHMDLTESYEAEKIKTPLKSMKKYIEIIPSFAQGSIDVDLSDNQNITMGTEDTSLWEYDGKNNKLFKIRITSRSTGKKIDLNVKFSHKHTKLVDEENQTTQ